MSDILTSITSFFHNATTGELTDAQRADISAASVDEYTPCAGGNSSLPECQDLYKQILGDVNKAAPSTGCVLNVPVIGCLAHSWGNLFFVVGGSILGVFLLWTMILTSPKRRF